MNKTAHQYQQAKNAIKKVDSLGFDTPGQAIYAIKVEAASGLDWVSSWDVSDMSPEDIDIINSYIGKTA